MTRYFLAAFAGLLLAAGLSPAYAQSYGQQSSNGMFGSRSTGGGISGANSSLSGGSSLNPNAGQLSGGDPNLRNVQGFVGAGDTGGFVGQAAASSSGMGQMGMGGMGSRGMSGMSGMGLGSTGRGMSGMGMSGLGGMGLGGSQFGGFQRNQFGGNNRFGSTGGQTNQRRAPFRTTMRAGFEAPARDTSTLSATLTRRLQSSTMLRSASPLSVRMNGQTAVLRGTVASAYDRELAERVVLLEPGVYQVENLLAVANSADADAATAPQRLSQ